MKHPVKTELTWVFEWRGSRFKLWQTRKPQPAFLVPLRLRTAPASEQPPRSSGQKLMYHTGNFRLSRQSGTENVNFSDLWAADRTVKQQRAALARLRAIKRRKNYVGDTGVELRIKFLELWLAARPK